MAVRSTAGAWGREVYVSVPKKTKQGSSKNTKYAATSRNSPKKRYRGQGK